MSITEFAEAVKKELETRTGENVEVNMMPKNNGVFLHGIVIKEKGSNVVPNIYLESFYEKYIHDEDMDYGEQAFLIASYITGHMKPDISKVPKIKRLSNVEEPWNRCRRA